MSYPLASITASAIASGGQDVDTLSRASGALCIFNLSQVAFIIKDSNGNQGFLSNGFADKFPFAEGSGHFTLIPQFTVVSGGPNPNTIAFIVLSEVENKLDHRTWPVPVGVTFGVTTVQSVQNDGNVTNTVFIESTALGDTQSDVSVTNDGNAYFRKFLQFGEHVSGTQSDIHYSLGTNMVVLEPPLAGATPQGLLIRSWSGSATISALQLGGSGGISTLAGQATAGSFGVPVILAQTLHKNVTATTLTNIITVSAPATGLYRFSGYFLFQNGTTPQNVNFVITWTDPDLNTTKATNFVSTENPPQTYATHSISTSPFTTGLMPVVVWAKGGANLFIDYQDAGGTPNDFVTGMVERLA